MDWLDRLPNIRNLRLKVEMFTPPLLEKLGALVMHYRHLTHVALSSPADWHTPQAEYLLWNWDQLAPNLEWFSCTTANVSRNIMGLSRNKKLHTLKLKVATDVGAITFFNSNDFLRQIAKFTTLTELSVGILKYFFYTSLHRRLLLIFGFI